MNMKELRQFYFDKTNFSPDDVKAREGHRYLARSQDGEKHPTSSAKSLGVYDAKTGRFLTAKQIERLSFDDAMNATSD